MTVLLLANRYAKHALFHYRSSIRRHCNYSAGDFEVFRPAGATRFTFRPAGAKLLPDVDEIRKVYAGNRSTKSINIWCDLVNKLGIHRQKAVMGHSP